MNQKTKKTLVLIILVVIVIGISGWLGDFAALIMSTSTTVNNGMLCQILFLSGLIAGVVLCLGLQELDRRNPLPDVNKPPKKDKHDKEYYDKGTLLDLVGYYRSRRNFHHGTGIAHGCYCSLCNDWSQSGIVHFRHCYRDWNRICPVHEMPWPNKEDE